MTAMKSPRAQKTNLFNYETERSPRVSPREQAEEKKEPPKFEMGKEQPVQ